MRPLTSSLRAFALVSPLALASCLTPPAVLVPPATDLDAARAPYPQGTEIVEVPVARGEHLRGLFVPAEPGAPVVLHLLEAGGSVAWKRLGYATLARQLMDLGYASLLVDYAGVGASDGKASPKNLARDARAAWDEAVARAGGEPSRVVIRATSLGTIAATHLVADGARPGGLMLILPVQGRTVARRFARVTYGPLGAFVATIFFAPVARVDPVDALAGIEGVPLAMVTCADERLAPAAWIEELGRVVRLGGGHSTTRPGDHFLTTLFAHELLVPEELDFLLDAVACAPPPPQDMRATRIAWVLDGRRPGLEASLRAALADLDDPAGPIPIDHLEDLARPLRTIARHGGFALLHDAESIAALSRRRARGVSSWWSSSVTLSNGLEVGVTVDLAQAFDRLVSHGYLGGDARRVFARLLLKSYAIPDRVVMDSEGTAPLEAWVDGEWRALDLEPRPGEKEEWYARFGMGSEDG